MGEFELAPFKPVIPFSLLEQVDVRVGTIVAVEPLPKSDKLVRLTVNFGDRPRNVVVGMKQEREHPEEITGLQALFVVNLEPRKIHASCPKRCSSTLATRTGSGPCLPYPKATFRTGRGWGRENTYLPRMKGRNL